MPDYVNTENIISSDEKVLWEGATQKRGVYYAIAAVNTAFVSLLALAAFIVFAADGGWPSRQEFFEPENIVFMAMVLFIVGVLYHMLRNRKYAQCMGGYLITDKKLLLQTAVPHSLAREQIQGFKVKRTILELLFGIATVQIKADGQGTDTVYFFGLTDPESCADALREMMD